MIDSCSCACATSARLQIVFVEFGPGMHTVPVQYWCVNAFVSISIALSYAPRNGGNTVKDICGLVNPRLPGTVRYV